MLAVHEGEPSMIIIGISKIIQAVVPPSVLGVMLAMNKRNYRQQLMSIKYKFQKISFVPAA
jgi:hypothetical protein